MPHAYAAIAFTSTVRRLQEEHGSRTSYARMEEINDPVGCCLGEVESGFIASRDSFYMASVSETGWPYIQHRGGPKGFVRILSATTIGFADFRGNRQYISVGNLMTDSRVSLFFMDYVRRRRLKLFGRAAIIGADDRDTLSRLEVTDYRARIERGLVITIEGFDWNCPQHIVPRYAAEDAGLAGNPMES